MQGRGVWSLVREDYARLRATNKPTCQNYWSPWDAATESTCPEFMLLNERSHCNKKPMHSRVAPAHSNENLVQQPPPKKPHWDTICWLKKTKNQKNTQSKSWNLCFIQRPYWGLQPGMAVSQIALRDYSEDVKKGTGIHRNFCWEKNNMRLHINRLLLIKKQIISS